MMTLTLCIVGIILAYGATWILIIKSRRIINLIDREELREAREIVQRLNL